MTEQATSILSIFESLMTAEAPKMSKSGGKYSLGIVNSKSNGKRLTLSKSIAENLKIETELYAMPAEDDRKLVLSKTKVFPHSVELKITDEGKRTSYCAPFVELLTDRFALDFSKHVSRTFYDVDFDTYENTLVAIVSFPEETAEATSEVSSEEAV